MKRLLLISSVLFFIFGFLLWGVYRLLWTPEGVRWLFKTVSHYSSLTLSAEKIGGRITGLLDLEGLKIVWAEGQVRIDKMQTRLKPFPLLRGKIVFEKIGLNRFVWEDQRTKNEPLDLSLPKISGLLSRLNLEVQTFGLEEFTYRHGEDPPLRIKTIGGRFSWKYGLAAASPIWLEVDSGRLQGAVGIGFNYPVLWVNIRLLPKRPLQGMDQIVIRGNLKGANAPEQLAGRISIQGRAGTQERFFSQTELGIAPHRIQFRKANIRATNRKGIIGGRAEVVFDQTGPAFQTWLNLNGLDFSREIGFTTSLSGSFHLVGRPDKYTGDFEFRNTNQSWQSFRLVGTLRGKKTGLDVRLVQSEWLKGSLNGRVNLNWSKTFSVNGSFTGRQLRPETIQPKWPGLINLELKGEFNRSTLGHNQGRLTLNLLESRFQGKVLQGQLRTRLENSSLAIERAVFRGRGFQLTGSGDLSKRLDFEARVDDLSALVTGSQGSFSTKGWVRWRNNRLGGQLALEGKNMYWAGTNIKGIKLEASLDQEEIDTAVSINTRIQELVYRSFKVHDFSGKADGTLSQLKISLFGAGPQGKIQARLVGAFREKQWKGTLVSLSGDTAPGAPFNLQSPATLLIGTNRFKLSPLVINGKKGERLSLEADIGLHPISGFLRTEWQAIDLARSRPYLGKGRLTGLTSGMIKAVFPAGGRLDLEAQAGLTGMFQTEDRRLEIKRGDLNLSWDDAGLHFSWNGEISGGARVWGEAVSSEKGQLAFPAEGSAKIFWEGIDLELLKLNLPPALRAQGKIMGRLQGNWNRGSRFSLSGQMKIGNGSLTWREKDTTFNTQIKKADVGFHWMEDRLQGDLILELDEYGKVSGNFSLPVPARFPVKVEPAGPLAFDLKGNVRENGLLTALFPEAVQTSRGEIVWDLSAKGTWERPSFSGNLELSEAGADILPLGLRIEKISAKGIFNQDRIDLTSLEMHSGPGRLEGHGILLLKDWKIAKVQAKLKGNRFQFINRPGIQALAAPDLDISGTPAHLSVSGVLEIPEALLSGQPQGFKRTSSDVVILDAPAPSPKETAWPIYGEIRLRLGPQVLLKAAGLEVLLREGLTVHIRSTNDIKAQGEILVQGHYLLQGQKLDISGGRFLFNGPPDNPVLDLLALRKIRRGEGLEGLGNEIQAGIAVTGTLRSPLIKLYSQPPLSETDTFSYILFGEPLKEGADKQNLMLLTKAAGTLLGGGMQNKLASRFGLDTLEIRSDGSDLSGSVLTVGKYLNPRLFLGLGGSLFSNSYHLILRYALTPNIEIETQGGTSNGGNIFYKVEFE